MRKLRLLLFCFQITISSWAQKSPESIESWVTTNDRNSLLEKQNNRIFFKKENSSRHPSIIIDPQRSMQTIDGFGFALTGGSAEHLMKMSALKRTELLNELFGSGEEDIGISYIRLSIGSSDLNSFTFSYNDLKDGETDYDLKKFSLAQDLKDVIPVMKEILEIYPEIKIMASPWSAPIWMKTNNNIRGGKLKKDCYEVYAQYFTKYIQEMRKLGIFIDAVTVQNEPMNSRNTPSMSWFWFEQANFIKNYLGPNLEKNNLKTKILIFDHNTDRPDYPLSILQDTLASKYIDGSGFHNYRGDMEAMSWVHTARPDKNIYFTEQMLTEKPESSTINIVDPVNRLIIGALSNWSRNVILWNLAADPNNDPHTGNGGCTMCQGAITIDGNSVSRNVAYYTIGHISKFVKPGSTRIFSTQGDEPSIFLYQDEQRPNVYRTGIRNNSQVLPNIAFRTTENKIVLIVGNDTLETQTVKIQYNGNYASVKLKGGSVGTYIWHY
ncbi:MAG: glucosylceramidase [Zunongwangia sp.]|uniref:Glucosylceramidase n=2 Tax=Zunongwangia profunda TaxID=398743 RepID=D5BDX8_ZUNPS|nr:glycoside hydrolase family 30 beta sandwich domain-containing protein [Zunongwangia profunda]ADF50719.1 glucosylceramidase [Zunongwangia profunda SM-A87]MAO37754.1 glucosylceramidase [Zunongwangia sp.]MAS69715.1 glucosylceramidase [Zunongwangia sp.]HCV81219.1 glucosylceramidase [Zunongwangia profunda]|tara:strand:- start:5455 stop:6939 length:1485 start_codon:yes stop_codon:yes gene_type:complete